jgi:hypothetical protein
MFSSRPGAIILIIKDFTMTDDEAKQLILDIINKPQEGKSLEFQPISYWSEFRYYSRLYRSTRLVIKTLKASANRLFKEYCKEVVAGTASVNKLLAYSQLLDIIAFYEADLSTIKRMLDDYDEYLGQGHFWYSFLGGQRDLWNTP